MGSNFSEVGQAQDKGRGVLKDGGGVDKEIKSGRVTPSRLVEKASK